MSCATQTFTGVSQARFNCLVQKAQGEGINITGNIGQVTSDGLTIRWSFNPVAQTLELQCMGKPFFLSCGIVNGKLHDAVDECP
jgi:hypothetical protein